MSFASGLPKAELHVHHIGSASPRIVSELAARHEGDTPVPADPALLADYFQFTDFAHFIDVYLSVVDLVRTPEDLWTLTYEVARDMTAQNVRYAELTLTPYTSIARGIAAEAYCETVEDARRAAEAELGIALRWCFDIPGESGLPAADVTLDTAGQLRPRRSGDRGAAAAVRAALPAGDRRGAAQRAARGGVDRAGDDLGRG
jgi:adenosine deaminase